MFVVSAVALAGAPVPTGPLAPKWEVGSVRDLKFDFFTFDVLNYPPAWMWDATDLEQFTMVLSCRVTAPRTEVCTFPQGLTWSVVLRGEHEIRSVHVTAPPQVELLYTDLGRVKHWDFQGDHAPFAEGITAAYVQLAFHRPNTKLAANTKREFGLEMEEMLGHAIVGLLDWEMPRDGRAEWDVIPQFGRRFGTSALNGHVRATAPALGAPGTTTPLHVAGNIGESTEGCMVATQLVGDATLDLALGRVTAIRLESLSSSNICRLVGPLHYVAVATPWKAGDPLDPLPFPERALVASH
jgi:hypothetical protein